ncbi:uncharacterized protein LOC116290318 [Actinia tenebrosa]|uniref:Uncharacterized protein LOC116290318 n=1 Tax=Actinia tenebrosa TaxID=6105 RepID=A0A6P8HKF8_ACTTE|nr:uncharacterized protein LOC116290318 [Actinia tenebrosa]XP_031553178.1 uncharacterized protein LOC116290318 [Actinia tenebrosa]
MAINVEAVEKAFEWETFEDGKPYLGTYKHEIPNRVRMMTMKLDPKDWIKIDRTYASQQHEKERLWQTLRDKVFVTNNNESTKLAKSELLQMICKYLPERYPDKFEAREGGVYNKMLQEFISTSEEPGEEDPLIKCGRLTQEDWCIMEWSDEHQAYCLTAGMVYFPMRWSLQEKWNLPMLDIHQPVDGFTKHLKSLVYNLFKTMAPDAPVYRGNWAVFNDLEGPLDLYTPVGHEHRNAAMGGVRPYEGEKTGRVLTFRCEYQTLRKLEKSKAIVFGIRTYQIYLEDFKKFPRKDTETLVKVIENIHPDFVEYKGARFWKDAALKYLRRDVLGEKESPGIVSFWKKGSALVVGISVLALAIALMKR